MTTLKKELIWSYNAQLEGDGWHNINIGIDISHFSRDGKISN